MTHLEILNTNLCDSTDFMLGMESGITLKGNKTGLIEIGEFLAGDWAGVKMVAAETWLQ